MVILGNQTAVQVPKEETLTPEQISVLIGFRDLLTERVCYSMGRAEIRAKMSKATKKERKNASGIRAGIKENLVQWVTDGNITEYEKQTALLTDASEIVSKKSKPFNKEISPLTKAMKFIDNIAVPDALGVMGIKPKPRFSLSDYMVAQLEKQEK